MCVQYTEAGAGEEKDCLWRETAQKVWHARRLWMGRRVTGIRLFLLVASRLCLAYLRKMLSATPLLFLDGSPSLTLALVLFFSFVKLLYIFSEHLSYFCFFLPLNWLQGRKVKRSISTTLCGQVGHLLIGLFLLLFSILVLPF